MNIAIRSTSLCLGSRLGRLWYKQKSPVLARDYLSHRMGNSFKSENYIVFQGARKDYKEGVHSISPNDWRARLEGVFLLNNHNGPKNCKAMLLIDHDTRKIDCISH
jgi:hypothetical protein